MAAAVCDRCWVFYVAGDAARGADVGSEIERCPHCDGALREVDAAELRVFIHELIDRRSRDKDG